MTPEIVAVLSVFSSEFSRPTWKNIQVLLIGAILCRGPRRVSSILRVMGLASIRNFSKYHRVLSRAQWNSLMPAKILLGLLGLGLKIATFAAICDKVPIQKNISIVHCFLLRFFPKFAVDLM